jgi:hypothetical protein
MGTDQVCLQPQLGPLGNFKIVQGTKGLITTLLNDSSAELSGQRSTLVP